MSPFDGCRQRLGRAKFHRDALSDMWREFATKEGAYTVRLRVNDDGTGSIWMSQVEDGGLFNTFALQFGEMLYQIRAALDGIVYQAAILETGQNPPPDEHNLEFPICGTAAEFAKKAPLYLRPLAQKRRDIIESVQPYKIPDLAPEDVVFNFNRALGILNDWARKDRHRRIHVAGSWVSNASPKIRCPPGVSLAYLHVTGSGLLKNESKIASFRLIGYDPSMNIATNPDLAIDVAVDEIPPPCADNDTLGNRGLAMLKAARWVVDTIEESF
jgi:hypothetical protein